MKSYPFWRILLWLIVFEIVFIGGGIFRLVHPKQMCNPHVVASCEP